MEYIEEIQEQVILVGVQLDENDNVKESLDELEELADTAEPRQWEKLSRTVRLYILELILEKERSRRYVLLCWPRMLQELSVTMNFPRHR